MQLTGRTSCSEAHVTCIQNNCKTGCSKGSFLEINLSNFFCRNRLEIFFDSRWYIFFQFEWYVLFCGCIQKLAAQLVMHMCLYPLRYVRLDHETMKLTVATQGRTKSWKGLYFLMALSLKRDTSSIPGMFIGVYTIILPVPVSTFQKCDTSLISRMFNSVLLYTSTLHF